MSIELEIRRLLMLGGNDLADELAGLTADEWLGVKAAAAMSRCVSCGETDGCVCDREDGDR